MRDSIFAFRQLRKSPAFVLTAILSLALGIGATTAVFSVVYGVLMNPYPYQGADRMAHLVLKDKAGNDRYTGLTGPQIRQVRKASCIESVLGEDEWNLTSAPTRSCPRMSWRSISRRMPPLTSACRS